MEVRFNSRKNAYTQSMARLKQTVSAKTGAAAPSKAQERLRDTVKLSYQHVLTAEQEGYIEVNGEKIAVSSDMAAAMRRSYDWAAAQNRAIQLQNEMKSNRANADREAEMKRKQTKSMEQAMEVYRRISKGGRVPPQDEEFLRQYSQEMYTMAKIQAMMAKKHETYDSVLEDEEAREEIDDEPDGTVHSAEATVSGGEVTDVSVETGTAEV